MVLQVQKWSIDDHTKRGKSGQTKSNRKQLLTIQGQAKRLPVLEFTRVCLISKITSLEFHRVIAPELTDPSILGPGTDWQNALFRRTNLQKHSLAISGGTDKATFYFR